MPRPAKGPRLTQRKDDGTWEIRDTGYRKRTGTTDRERAEIALSEYIAAKHSGIQGVCDPYQVTCGQALNTYGIEHAPTVADPARIGYAMDALLPFWGDVLVGNITGNLCRRYCRERGVSNWTLRRELGVLQAAINHCHREGYLTAPRAVWKPEKGQRSERWLTRSEAAKLLWAAYRAPKGKHLARFILVALYTGTRKTAILNLRYSPQTAGGYVDLDKGMLYRIGGGERVTAKRRTPAKLPRQLLSHLRRWEKEGGRYVVEWKGERPAQIRKAWAGALTRSGIDHCNPHDLKHTAITWAMQRGVQLSDAAAFFSTSVDTLEKTYWHHHPDFQQSAVRAMEGR